MTIGEQLESLYKVSQRQKEELDVVEKHLESLSTDSAEYGIALRICDILWERLAETLESIDILEDKEAVESARHFAEYHMNNDTLDTY